MLRSIMFLTLSLVCNASQFNEIHFTKVCKRCHKISNEIQIYAYNEWTMSWQRSWRSDTNRPGCCEQCYFELQPKVKFLEKPLNAYSIGNYDVTSNNEDNSNYMYKWWNNGIREVISKSKPLGIGWNLGRLKKNN